MDISSMVLASETKTALINFFANVQDVELEVESMRRNLVKSQGFKASVAFQSLVQGRDPSACISSTSLLQFMRKYKPAISDNDIFCLIRTLSRSGDSRVSYPEFREAVLPFDSRHWNPVESGCCPHQRIEIEKSICSFLIHEIDMFNRLESYRRDLFRAHKFSLLDAFRFLDPHKEGKITPKGLHCACLDHPSKVESLDTAPIFRRLDKDRDGALSYLEFVESVLPSVSPNSGECGKTVDSMEPRSGARSKTIDCGISKKNCCQNCFCKTCLLPASAHFCPSAAHRSASTEAMPSSSHTDDMTSTCHTEDMSTICPTLEMQNKVPNRSTGLNIPECGTSFSLSALQRNTRPNRRYPSTPSHQPRRNFDEPLAQRKPIRSQSPSQPRVTSLPQLSATSSTCVSDGFSARPIRRVNRELTYPQVRPSTRAGLNTTGVRPTFPGECAGRAPRGERPSITVSQLVWLLQKQLNYDRSTEAAKNDLAMRKDFNLLALWQCCDTSNKGYATAHDTMNMMRQLDLDVTLEDAEQFMQRYGNEEQCMRYSDMCRVVLPSNSFLAEKVNNRLCQYVVNMSPDTRLLLQRVLQTALEVELQWQSLRSGLDGYSLYEVFHDVDADKDGFITFDEFRSIFRSNGIQATEQEIWNLMRRYDVNQDGRISYAEYVNELMQ